MPVAREYTTQEPTRAEVDRLDGPTLLEFGNPWCGYCRRAAPLIEAALSNHPSVRHIRIADSSGRRLGRSFRIKLWPTLVFLRDGKEISHLIRPSAESDIRQSLAEIDPV